MNQSYFELLPKNNGFSLEVSRELTVGAEDSLFMFGGVGLGAAIEAMEKFTGRNCIWASAQFLSYAGLNDVIDIYPEIVSEGKYITQARCKIFKGEKEILLAFASFGSANGQTDQWAKPTIIKPPLECEEVMHWRKNTNSVHEQFEMRLAHGRYPDGRWIEGRSDDGIVSLWIRPRKNYAINKMLLSIIADFISPASANALGRPAGGNSLDNSIRFMNINPTEWILCDLKIDAVFEGIIQGSAFIYDERGNLMASGGQSLILRRGLKR